MTETPSTPRPRSGAPPPPATPCSTSAACRPLPRHGRRVPAVDGISFTLGRGQTLGIVGESGSGKSVTALTIMRLLDIPPAEIVEGEVWFDGREILRIPIDEMRRIRGNDMAMIFQEPLTSLNPVFTVGDQIAEQVELHMKVGQEGGLGPGDRGARASSASRSPSGGSSSTRTRCRAACASA